MNIRTRIAAVGLGLSFFATGAQSAGHKTSMSDQALKARFLAHRVDFERLVAMAKQDDQLSRIAFDFTWLNDDVGWPRENIGISQERWSDYRQEFRRIGDPAGIIIYPGRILFPIVSEGLVPAGYEKGIVYSETPLSPVLDSLDKKPPSQLWDGPDRSHFLAYEPIDAHWYLFYQQWV